MTRDVCVTRPVDAQDAQTGLDLPGIGAMAVMTAGLSMLGQFAIATYLPAFAAIGSALHASTAQVQQSLTAYLLPFALLLPWHGAISDAIGRRRMILAGCALFVAGSLLCAAATGIGMLYAGRALEGVGAGIGVIVGRAMVRDTFDGMQAQKVMALIAMIFALAPAVAPICGGWLLVWLGWRSIFLFLALVSGGLLVSCWLWVPETLPPARRHPLHPAILARGYLGMLSSRRFMALSLANAGVNLAIYIYVFAAPRFVYQHLGLGAQSFGWLFIPIVAGIIVGGMVAHRIAGRASPEASVFQGHALMLAAGAFNLAVTVLHAPAMPWALVALPIFAAGMTMTQPSLQLLALDCFPERRGLASSGYITVQQVGNLLSSAMLVPLLLDSTVKMAVGMAGLQLAGLVAFYVALGRRSRKG